jgi:hypothetical protein
MSELPAAPAPTRLIDAFHRQVAWCQGPAPFSARVLAAAARWLQGNAAAHAEFEALAEDPLAAAVPLRLLAGLHHLALLGLRPWSAVWPPAESEVDDTVLESLVAQAWAFQGEHLARAMAAPPQTNEVQRSAALLPGLLHVARRTGLPLVLLEIGASAGLNLWPEHLQLQGPGWARGPAGAALTLAPQWEGPPPPADGLVVEHRAGCDVQPVDLMADGEALRLASFVWADQADRLARLRSAAALAQAQMAATGVRVMAQRAAPFLRQQLTLRLPGQAMVLMHSVMWQYLDAAEQRQVEALMQAAAATATDDMPLAWLRFEPQLPDQHMELRCRLWPGGEDSLLAHCHPHGSWVRWLADASAGAAA